MAPVTEAIVLAGGFGTRLRSVVSDVPKPLAPIRGRPFLHFLLDRLVTGGIQRAVLATGYGADAIRESVGSSWQGMSIAYSQEDEPLGTGGAMHLASSLIEGKRFFALNGDTFLRLDYQAFDRCLSAQDASLGMALAQVPDTARYGAVMVSGQHVERFVEKGRAGPGYINAGVYCIDKSLFASQDEVASFSFEREVLEPLVTRGVVAAYTDTSGFIDIGVPEDYERAQREIQA